MAGKQSRREKCTVGRKHSPCCSRCRSACPLPAPPDDYSTYSRQLIVWPLACDTVGSIFVTSLVDLALPGFALTSVLGNVQVAVSTRPCWYLDVAAQRRCWNRLCSRDKHRRIRRERGAGHRSRSFGTDRGFRDFLGFAFRNELLPLLIYRLAPRLLRDRRSYLVDESLGIYLY